MMITSHRHLYVRYIVVGFHLKVQYASIYVCNKYIDSDDYDTSYMSRFNVRDVFSNPPSESRDLNPVSRPLSCYRHLQCISESRVSHCSMITRECVRYAYLSSCITIILVWSRR